MTATVVDLQSRIRNRPPACGCGRHRLEALVERSIAELAGTDGELVVDRQLVADLVADLVATVKAALEAPVGKTNP